MPIILDKAMPNKIKAKIGKYFNKKTIDTFPLANVYSALNTHPDIQIHFMSPEIAICAPECFEYYTDAFGKNKIKLLKGSSSPADTYPADAAYNVARVGKHVFCNTRHAEPAIIEYYVSHGFNIHHINQGYSKCNMCIASENTVITEDKGIYGTLCKVPDINSLLIKPGSVSLNGYKYGFIGGASGLVNSTAVFTGKVSEQIRIFLNHCEIKYFEASASDLKDFGSIIYRR